MDDTAYRFRMSDMARPPFSIHRLHPIILAAACRRTDPHLDLRRLHKCYANIAARPAISAQSHAEPWRDRALARRTLRRGMAKRAGASSRRRARCIDNSVREYRDRGRRVTTEFVLLLAIGFAAQLVDGTLGMAYGVLSNAAMLTMGLPPAHASALVHTAEIFTTGASAASH